MSYDTPSDKGFELLRRVIQKKGFAVDIAVFREQQGIPVGGFESKEAAFAWQERRVMRLTEHINKTAKMAEPLLEQSAQYEEGIAKILSKFRLPPTVGSLLEEYALFPLGFEKVGDASEFICAIDFPFLDDSPMSNEARWKKMGAPYARLLIHGEASKNDLHKFIDKNWSKITRFLARERETKSNRIRTKNNAKRDERIIQLSGMEWDLLRPLLPEHVRDDSMNKSQMIIYIVNAEFPDKKINSDIVRAVRRINKKQRES